MGGLTQKAPGGRQERKADGETRTGESNRGLGESGGVPSEGAQVSKEQQATDSTTAQLGGSWMLPEGPGVAPC